MYISDTLRSFLFQLPSIFHMGVNTCHRSAIYDDSTLLWVLGAGVQFGLIGLRYNSLRRSLISVVKLLWRRFAGEENRSLCSDMLVGVFLGCGSAIHFIVRDVEDSLPFNTDAHFMMNSFTI